MNDNTDDYEKGFREGMSVNSKYPHMLSIMGYSFDKILKLIIADSERWDNLTEREKFRQALSDAGHAEATVYGHWALSAYDRAHPNQK